MDPTDKLRDARETIDELAGLIWAIVGYLTACKALVALLTP